MSSRIAVTMSPIGLLRWLRSGELNGLDNPGFQVAVPSYAVGGDDDHPAHGPPGEVHLGGSGVDSRVVVVLADADHQVIVDDAARHVGVDDEGQAAEHLALVEVGQLREQLTRPPGKVLVVGHAQSPWRVSSRYLSLRRSLV